MTPTQTPFSQIFNSSEPLAEGLVSLMWALLVLVIALVAARYTKRWVVRLFTRRRVGLNVATLLGNLAQVTLVVLGIILALHTFLDWPELFALVGVAGLAISLSLQDLLKNVIAGIYILMEQPFRIGDRISVKEVTGAVQGIELRTTILRTDEDLQVVVPNSTIMNEILINRSASNLQRQVVTVRTRSGSLADTSEEVLKALRDFPEIATSPAPVTALEGVGEGMAHLRVEFWVPAGERLAVTSRVVEALQTRFPGATVAVA